MVAINCRTALTIRIMNSRNVRTIMDWNPTIAVLGFLACLGAYFARFGYDYGNSDQDELIPAVYRVLSEGVLFSQDWFVSQQTAHFGVRTTTIELVAALARISSPYVAVTILYVASAAAIYLGVYWLSSRVTSARSAPWLACLFVLVLAKGFTLGGNDLLHELFVPSMAAWALATWALCAWFSGNHLAAGILGGLSVPFQALVGLQLVPLFGLASMLLWRWRSEPAHIIGFVRFGLAFGFIAAVPVYLLLSSGIGPTTPTTADPFMDILATIRAPHHFLPTAFPVQSVVRFALLAVAGTVALVRLPTWPDRDGFVAILVSVGIICSAAFVFTVVFPLTPVVKLQLFKLTVHAKLLFGIAAVTAIVTVLESRFNPELLRVLAPVAPVVLLVVALVVAPKRAFLQHEKRAESDWGVVERWIETEIATDAVFLIPPSNGHFRSSAKRSIVVNYKATPFDAENLTEWRRRIDLVTGGQGLSPGVKARELDRHYANLNRVQLANVALTTGADFVITTNPLDSVATVFSAGSLLIYSRSSLTK